MTFLTRYEYYCHPPYLIVTGALNLPPLVLSVYGIADWCPYFSHWLAANGALSVLHILAACYFVYRIRVMARVSSTTEEESMEEGDSDRSTDTFEDNKVASTRAANSAGCFSRLVHYRTTSSNRLRHLICYDGFFATYCIIFMFWLFWLAEGSQILYRADDADEIEMEGCLTLHDRYMKTSVLCGFMYVVFVAVSSLISFC